MKLVSAIILSVAFISQANADCPNLAGTIEKCEIISVKSDKSRIERKTIEVVEKGIKSGALDIPVTQDRIASLDQSESYHLYKDPYNEYITNNQLHENESGEYTRSWCQGGILYTNIYNANNESSLSSETSYRINPSDQKVYIEFRGDLIGGGNTATLNLKCELN